MIEIIFKKIIINIFIIFFSSLLIFQSGCGETIDSKVEKDIYSQVEIDSVLNQFVPTYKRSSPLYKQWRERQSEAFRRDSLGFDLVSNAIKWHRENISYLTKMENYITYPLVEKTKVKNPFQSITAIDITELNVTPHLAQQVIFPNDSTNGILLDTLSEALINHILTFCDTDFIDRNHFHDVCITLAEFLTPDPQLILTSESQWELFMLVDRFARKNRGNAEINRLAENILSYVTSQTAIYSLDTLPDALKFVVLADSLIPNWRSNYQTTSVFKANPTFRDSTFRAQIDFMDSYSLSVIRRVFKFKQNEGMKLRDIVLKWHERGRIRIITVPEDN